MVCNNTKLNSITFRFVKPNFLTLIEFELLSRIMDFAYILGAIEWRIILHDYRCGHVANHKSSRASYHVYITIYNHDNRV